MRIAERLRMVRMRRAMSMNQAKEILGFPPTANPSKSEIEREYRKKALENHPDRGGDIEKMKAINVARDVLEGRQRPTPEPGPSTRQPYSQPQPPPPRPRQPPQKKEVTWEQAYQAVKGDIPAGTEWIFKTEDVFLNLGKRSASGFVVCGRSANSYVFVGIEGYSIDPTINEPVQTDITTMKVLREPLSLPPARFANALNTLFASMPNLNKKFNGKVNIYPKSFKDFTVRNVDVLGLRSMRLQDALIQLGIADASKVKKGKLSLILELTPQGSSDFFDAIIFVNGKPYVLSTLTRNDLGNKFWRKVFGEYYHQGGQKNLTRLRAKDAVIGHLLKVCEKNREPAPLLEALRSALEGK